MELKKQIEQKLKYFDKVYLIDMHSFGRNIGSIKNIDLVNITLLETISDAFYLGDDSDSSLNLTNFSLINSTIKQNLKFNVGLFKSDFSSLQSLKNVRFNKSIIKDKDIVKVEFTDDELIVFNSSLSDFSIKYPPKTQDNESIIVQTSSNVTLSVKYWKTKIHEDVTIDILSEDQKPHKVYFDYSFMFVENSNDLTITSSSDLILFTNLGSIPNVFVPVEDQVEVTRIWSYTPTPTATPSMSPTPLAVDITAIPKSQTIIETITYNYSESETLVYSKYSTLIDGVNTYLITETNIFIPIYYSFYTSYVLKYYVYQKVIPKQDEKISELAIIGIAFGGLILLVFLATIGITIRRHYFMDDLYESSDDDYRRRKKKEKH